MTNNIPNHQESTLIFGLSREDIRPIIEAAVGARVAFFAISVKHPRPEPYGFQADKAIRTFSYQTDCGDSGQISIFIKHYHYTGSVEAQQYKFLRAQHMPVPHLYGTLLDPEGKQILFLEYVEPGLKALSPFTIERRREFFALMARLHALQPTAEYAAWLEQSLGKFTDILTDAELVLEPLWEHARAGTLGRALQEFCALSARNLPKIRSIIRHVIDCTRQMPQGLVHLDFSRENTGRRRTGELLLLDLEGVRFGPHCFDIAEYLGWPPDRWPPNVTQSELAQYYLDEYLRWGGMPLSLEAFFADIRILCVAHHMRYLDWHLKRSLGSWDTAPADHDERRICCDTLYRTLTLLHAQYTLRGTRYSVFDRW